MLVVSHCFKLFSLFQLVSCVSLLHVFGCFEVVLGSDSDVLRLPYANLNR